MVYWWYGTSYDEQLWTWLASQIDKGAQPWRASRAELFIVLPCALILATIVVLLVLKLYQKVKQRMRPNPSIERTSKTLQVSSASHVKR